MGTEDRAELVTTASTSRYRVRRGVRVVVGVIVVWIVVLPIYSALLLREISRNSREVARLAQSRDVAQTQRAAAEAALKKTTDAMQQAEVALQKKEAELARVEGLLRQFRDDIIDKPTFLRSALGIQTTAQRGHDLARRIASLRKAKNWRKAVELADGALHLHKADPTPADQGILIESALLYKDLADTDLATRQGLKDLLHSPARLDVRLTSEKLFEEVATSSDSTPPFVLGNFGVLLLDLVRETASATDPQLQRLAKAIDLLGRADDAYPKEPAWRERLIAATALKLRHQPEELLLFCRGLKDKGRSRENCSRELYLSSARNRQRLSKRTQMDLVCEAATLSAAKPQVADECRRLRTYCERNPSACDKRPHD